MGQLEAIRQIHSLVSEKDLVVGNMDMNTWCFQAVVRSTEPKGRTPKNLLCGVDMGFCVATALGIALALPHRKVIAVDGDGAICMKMGILPDVGEANPSNLVIVVVDNESYGGTLPTRTATVADLSAIAKASGIKNAVTVRTADELKKEFSLALARNELSFIVAKVELKPEETKEIFDQRFWVDIEWEAAFIRNLEATEGIKLIHTTTF